MQCRRSDSLIPSNVIIVVFLLRSTSNLPETKQVGRNGSSVGSGRSDGGSVGDPAPSPPSSSPITTGKVTVHLPLGFPKRILTWYKGDTKLQEYVDLTVIQVGLTLLYRIDSLHVPGMGIKLSSTMVIQQDESDLKLKNVPGELVPYKAIRWSSDPLYPANSFIDIKTKSAIAELTCFLAGVKALDGVDSTQLANKNSPFMSQGLVYACILGPLGKSASDPVGFFLPRGSIAYNQVFKAVKKRMQPEDVETGFLGFLVLGRELISGFNPVAPENRKAGGSLYGSPINGRVHSTTVEDISRPTTTGDQRGRSSPPPITYRHSPPRHDHGKEESFE